MERGMRCFGAIGLLVGGLMLAGCQRSAGPTEGGEAPPAPAVETPETPKPETPKPETPKPETPPPAEGWPRVDLAAHGLLGTVDVPPGVEVVGDPTEEHDADGLRVKVPGVRLGSPACGVTLRPVAKPIERLASPEAMAAFHGQFEPVGTHRFGADHWAVVQRWRPGECMLHGWSQPAGLICDVFKCACDDMQRWVDVCASVRAGAQPNRVEAQAAEALPDLDPAAAAVAAQVARAVARGDIASLVGALGPKGLRVGEAQLTAEALAARVKAAEHLMAVIAPDWFASVGADPTQLAWRGGGEGGEARVFFSGGYGEQPYFALEKAGAAWHLVRFGVEDLGEP